jgi:hypothetical protein
MYLKYLLISIYFFVLVPFVQAANDSWYKGVIQLNTKEKVWGEINYNPQYDIIQCKNEGMIKAFSAHNVVAFRFFDEELSVNRYFRTVEEKRGFYKKKSFYEIVIDGNLKIIRKKKNFTSFKSSPEEYSVHEKDYNYFVLNGGRLTKISKFKKEIIRGMMRDREEEIKSYMKAEKLYSYRLRDQILIVDRYNELKGTESQKLSGVVGQ